MKIAGFLFVIILISSLAFAEAFIDKGVTYTSPWWQVNAGDGSNVLVVDDSGNMYINATTIFLNTLPPSILTNSLIMQVGSTRKFSFNSSHAYIAGTVYPQQSSIAAGDGNDLVVNNSTGAIVARFDGGDGNIYLKGFVNDADGDGYSILTGDCNDSNSSITLPIAQSTTTGWYGGAYDISKCRGDTCDGDKKNMFYCYAGANIPGGCRDIWDYSCSRARSVYCWTTITYVCP